MSRIRGKCIGHKLEAGLDMVTESDTEAGLNMDVRLPIGNRTRQNFEALMLPHLDILYHIATKVMDDDCNAQNLVKESFVTAYHSWYKDHFNSSCRIWLFKIMVNILVEKYRPVPHLTSVINGADQNEGYLKYSRLRKQQPIVYSDEISFAAISKDDITKAIKDLPDDIRLLLALSLLAGLSYLEIAEIVGVDWETVKIKLRQGRRLIQRKVLNHETLPENTANANCMEN